jgi:tRNA-dihydrouridine synthase
MGQESAPDFARALDEAGVAAIAVHGRFAKQFYRDQADWSSIKRVVEATSLPVIGSGDVYTHEDADRMRAETGCAAVMVARGSYGNPWIFKGMVPTPEQRINAFATHVRLLEATGAHMARARSLAGFYLKGMPHAAALRQEAMTCNTTKDYLDLGERVLERVGQLDA